jgi:diacylglycerol kinase
MVNTALEKTIDFISVEKHPQIKLIKDVAAGAVLIAAIAAVIVGCFIFIPKLISL